VSTEVEEIDITSLLDILVILIVFLLRSFSSSELQLDLIKNLTLPYSYSTGMAKKGPIVQLNADGDLYLDKDILGNIFKDNALNNLTTRLLEISNSEDSQTIKKDSFLINLVVDKESLYKDIDRVLAASAKARFSKYKLIVQGVD
jgi:biopolymer transport protein ExbD